MKVAISFNQESVSDATDFKPNMPVRLSVTKQEAQPWQDPNKQVNMETDNPKFAFNSMPASEKGRDALEASDLSVVSSQIGTVVMSYKGKLFNVLVKEK